MVRVALLVLFLVLVGCYTKPDVPEFPSEEPRQLYPTQKATG